MTKALCNDIRYRRPTHLKQKKNKLTLVGIRRRIHVFLRLEILSQSTLAHSIDAEILKPKE